MTRRARLGEDWRAWSPRERLRFVFAILLVAAGTVAHAAFLPTPLTLLPLAILATVLFSRRCRDTLRLLCYLSALLNMLAGYYAFALLPSSALLGLAGLMAPDGVRTSSGGT